MALQFILGSAGSGKSRKLYEMLIEESMERTNENFLALVPEQYSMETQKTILTLHPRKGSFNIEVTSMNRLAFQVFEEQGINGYSILDELGKTLIIKKVLQDVKDNLTVYKQKVSKPGFAEKIKTLISELKQYGIDSGDVKGIKEVLSNEPGLLHKLDDIDIIYREFNNYLSDKLFTNDDVLNYFCKIIPDSDFIKNSSFYLDGFTGFTPIQLRVLELLMIYAKDVKLTLLLPYKDREYLSGDLKMYDEMELFYLTKETIYKLDLIAKKNNIEVLDYLFADEEKLPYRIKDNKEFCFVEKNIFRNTREKLNTFKNIEIYRNLNPYKETEFVSEYITYLISKKGYRYRDIAVVTGDLANYEKQMREAFEKNNIPVFIDQKRNISSNPFAETILAILNIIEKDYSYDSVMHLLRLDTVIDEAEKKDYFDNYIYRSGRRGNRSYHKKWEKKYRGFEDETIIYVNEIRQALIDIVDPVRNVIKKKDAKVSEKIEAIYDFIKAINMADAIEKKKKYFDNLKKENEFNMDILSKSKEYDQIYDKILEILMRIHTLLGEEVLSHNDFYEVLKAGFESVEVGIIPPGMDNVMVGDIQRTRLNDIKKIVFFIGVNDGIIPQTSVNGGIITDREREVLEKLNYSLAPTSRLNMFTQKMYLYSLMAKPTEKMILTFSNAGNDGKTRRQSYFIKEINKLCESLEIIDADKVKWEISTKDMALKYLSNNIDAMKNNSIDKEFVNVFDLINSHKDYHRYIDYILKGAFYDNSVEALDKSVADDLYSAYTNIGTTRLEKYSKCAFASFLDIGLKLNPRESDDLKHYELGNVYHDTLFHYFNHLKDNNIDYSDFSEEESDELVSKCFDRAIENVDDEVILEDTNKGAFVREQMLNITKTSAKALIRHVGLGQFNPTYFEKKIKRGIIDRVDIFEKDNEIYVKIIDYKSGDKSFSLGETVDGTELQLMTYMSDIIDELKKVYPDKVIHPAGGYYFRVYNPSIDYNDAFKDNGLENDAEVIKSICDIARNKKFIMSGLANKNDEVLSAFDENILHNHNTDVINIKINKSSEVKGNVIEEDYYTKLLRYVNDLSEDIKSEIKSGCIDINPIKKACEYCDYKHICNFDETMNNEYRKPTSIKIDELKELLDDKYNSN